MTKGMYESIEIDASPEEVYAVAEDVAAYPDWAQGVKSVEVLETDDDGRVLRASFTISGFVKEISYTLTYEHDHPGRMSWEADAGPDVKELTGSYDFAPKGDKTVVTYALRVQPNFPVPGFAMRQGEKQIIGAALRGLKRRAEG
jgi:uncharacterized membrane protein